MSTSHAINESPQSSKPQLRVRFKAYLKRRARQFSYLLLFLVLGLLFLAAVLEIYRGASLLGLRDIGDPFDVAAFRSFRVADDQDAMAALREVNEKLRLAAMPRLPDAVRRLGPSVGWSKAEPEIRDWVMAHRELLTMFQAAAERPDGIPHPDADREPSYYYLGELSWLVILEASRLQEQGDMAGAWSWYRALFRMKNHVIRRGSIFQRFVVDRNCSSLTPAIAIWAADKRTSASLIRKALDDVLAGEPKSEWDAFSLKVDYLEMMYELDKPWGLVQQGNDEDQHVTIWGEDLPPNLAWMSYAAKRYIASEPERSRRVLRLAIANWLAHAEEKDPRLRKAVLRQKFAPKTPRRQSPSTPSAPLRPPPPALCLPSRWPGG